MNQNETTASPVAGKQSHKKQIRREILEKLNGALAEYKQDLGEKKLASHVRKASKLISRDLERITKKQERSKKKDSHKEAKHKDQAKQKGQAKHKEQAKLKNQAKQKEAKKQKEVAK